VSGYLIADVTAVSDPGCMSATSRKCRRRLVAECQYAQWTDPSVSAVSTKQLAGICVAPHADPGGHGHTARYQSPRQMTLEEPSSQAYFISTEERVSSESYSDRVNGPDPTEKELSELARLSQRFRAHHIFRDVTRDRGVRYIAHGATIGVRPNTIITGDLAELRDELEASSRQLDVVVG
jgi:hypothetical protein